MSDIILHHYPGSPFAEKVRVALGIKGASWRSVTIPVVMPKPELMPLTGGYRKTPVMQIGADIYCDTHCILRELERRIPQPSLYQGTGRGLADALAFWSERSLFASAAGIVLGAGDHELPPGFIEDRSKLVGRELDPQRLKAAIPQLVEQMRPALAWFEDMLEDGRPFLMGQHPTVVDCSLYCPCWFLAGSVGTSAAPLAELPRIRAWLQRMAKIGHGQPSEMSPQEALAVAKAVLPELEPRADAHDPFGRKPGIQVQVAPDDIGRDPVVGQLVASSAEEIVIRRLDPQVGEVAVHFPRAGFVLQPA